MSGMMERLRNLSGRGASAEGDTPKSQGTTSPKSQDTWRDLDPNYNPNMHKAGRDVYDSVDDPKTAPGIWDYHLQAEKAEKEASRDVARAAFTSMGGQGDVLEPGSLRKMFAGDRVDEIMKLADRNKDGKIDFKEFCDLIRKYPCD